MDKNGCMVDGWIYTYISRCVDGSICILISNLIAILRLGLEAAERDGLQDRAGGRVQVGHRRCRDGVGGVASTLAVAIRVRQIAPRRRQVVVCSRKRSVEWRDVGRGVCDDGLGMSCGGA